MKFSDTFRTPQVNCPLSATIHFLLPLTQWPPIPLSLLLLWFVLYGSVWRLEVDLGCVLIVPHLVLRTRPLTELEITSWARLASQQVPEIQVSLSPWGWDYRCPSVPCFFVGAGHPNSGRHCLYGRPFADSLPALSFAFNYYALVCVPYNQSILPSRLCQFGSKLSLGRVCLPVSTWRKTFSQTPSLPCSLFLPFLPNWVFRFLFLPFVSSWLVFAASVAKFRLKILLSLQNSRPVWMFS